MKLVNRLLTLLGPRGSSEGYSSNYSYAELYDSYIDKIRERGWQIERVGQEDIYLDRFTTPDRRPISLLITAGIHGNEPAGILALFRLLSEQSPDEWPDISLTIITCINRWGFETGSRYNYESLDLNRCFAFASPRELKLYKSSLNQKRFHFYIDLHEDFRCSKHYIYDALFYHQSFANRLLKGLSERGGLALKRRTYTLPAPGRIPINRAARLLARLLPLGNSLYLLKKHVISGFVLETGRQGPLEERVETQLMTIKGVLSRIEGFKLREGRKSDLLWVRVRSLFERLDFTAIKAEDLLIATYGTKRVGFIRIKRKSEFTELGNMFVIKKYRRLGCFDLLLKEALNRVKEREVYSISRKSIYRLLKKFGFDHAREKLPPTLQKRYRMSRFLGVIFFNNYDLLVRNRGTYSSAPTE